MRLAAERPAERYDRIVWWGGLTSLALGFALALALAIWLAFSAPGVAWALPVAIVAIGVAMVTLPRSPYTPVALYLGLFTTVSGHSVGLQPHEILFAFVHTGYIAWWFWTRGMVRRERILRDVGDMTLMAFVVYAVGSLGLTVLFGGNVTDGVAEALTMSLFAAYFPVREAFERAGKTSDDAFALAVMAAVFLFGLVGALRVVSTTYLALSSVEHAWQIARGRVPMNEVFVYSASLLALAMTSVSRKPTRFAILSGGFALFTVALILTQWRSYYVAWALAAGIILALIGSAGRRRAGLLLGASLVIGGGLATIIFGDALQLAALGIADRVLSIGTSTTQDVSLMNRYLESYAIWDRILENPIVGHGVGVSFSFFDTIYNGTWTKTFAHNTYLMLWFKFGAFGLGLFLTSWVAAAVSGLKASRSATPEVRAVGAFVAGALIAFTLSSLVSGAFATDDVIVAFTLLLAAGAALRTRMAAARVRTGPLPPKTSPQGVDARPVDDGC